MRIGIISDTHDNHRNVRRAIEIFNEQAVEYVLHAGDMTAPSTASLFAALRGSRFIAVMGNCDADRLSLRSAIEAFAGEAHESCFDGAIDGQAVYMSHIPHAAKQAIDSGAYDLVVYGHTHHPDIHRVGRTLIVNPGAARNWMGQGGQVLIVDLSDMNVTAQSL
ncbi:MAG TPA: YfcE family phosphodiesterase [Sedimentisphaerales bacterium]|nr:YfcE family phosphodiesterase [Sedimentisphaerales bacterium]HRS12866.1 YfcE family phosphodiesterase [Sedimentisphaerales bacterium]HRV49477.1 YfcE family phosphodiesterase [Sedimentisphaerales bacterium]